MYTSMCSKQSFKIRGLGCMSESNDDGLIDFNMYACDFILDMFIAYFVICQMHVKELQLLTHVFNLSWYKYVSLVNSCILNNQKWM